MSTVSKRLLKEIRKLANEQNSRPLLENDFVVVLDETNVNKVKAIIKGNYDSVYRHKFIRLDFTIPENYPHSPPEVQFVNYDSVRIHPNMYENGKCCATILNTWGDSKFEKWTSSMGIETVLLTFQSFLDWNPYTYEPGGRDDPSYTDFVLYYSWQTCLTRYIQYEKEPLFRQFIEKYMLANIDSIFTDLNASRDRFPAGTYSTRCFEIGEYEMNYPKLIQIIESTFSYIDFSEPDEENALICDTDLLSNGDYQCGICYDTGANGAEGTNRAANGVIQIHCGHSFHRECLRTHVLNNNGVCSMCRGELTPEDNLLLETNGSCTNGSCDWIVNPLTNRKIKVHGKTYNYLVAMGTIVP